MYVPSALALTNQQSGKAGLAPYYEMFCINMMHFYVLVTRREEKKNPF